MTHRQSSGTTLGLTLMALAAFAANSLLGRLALRSSPQSPPKIDPAYFTGIRLTSGAIMLVLLFSFRRYWIKGAGAEPRPSGEWPSALALFLYAASFSFAYLRLNAGTGALILFGAVQITMISRSLFQGAKPRISEWLGLGMALSGLVYLTAPGLEAPDALGAALMALAGISWGVYTWRGKGARDPLAATTGNFVLSLAFALPLAAIGLAKSQAPISYPGLGLAVLSGAVSSGVGYSIWYLALRGLTATRAGVVQLLVPVLAALGANMLLGESLSTRLLISGLIILSGIGCAVLYPKGKSDRAQGR
jgi:drug/metabolite transporter (DMT)-like permease